VQYTQTQTAKAYNAPYRVQVGSLETTIDLEASTKITEDNNQLIVEICVGSCLDGQGCGDGYCDDSEDCNTCPADCGVCPIDCIHEADQVPCDGCIDTNELSDYIGLWKTGTVEITELMEAIGLWKQDCP